MGSGITFGDGGFYVIHKITQWPFAVAAWEKDGSLLVPYIADGKSGALCKADLDSYTVLPLGTLPTPKPDHSATWEHHIRMISEAFFDEFPEATDKDRRRWEQDRARFHGQIDAEQKNYELSKRQKTTVPHCAEHKIGHDGVCPFCDGGQS